MNCSQDGKRPFMIMGLVGYTHNTRAFFFFSFVS
jgi:hypothetical protein